MPSVIPEKYSSPELQHALGKDQIPKAEVPGRIHKPEFRQFWEEELRPSPMVWDAICNGYRLPLSEMPPRTHLPNNGSARKEENQEFLDEDILALENSNAISRAKRVPYLILPLQISHPVGRRKRLIVDASQSLNMFLVERKVKLDHLSKILPELPEDSLFASMDLSRGYYHLFVREDQRELLGF